MSGRADPDDSEEQKWMDGSSMLKALIQAMTEAGGLEPAAVCLCMCVLTVHM